MVSVIVRYGSNDHAVEAASIAELYSLAARSFSVADESTVRLIYRGTLLNRTDTRVELTPDAVVLMTIGNPSSGPQPSAAPHMHAHGAPNMGGAFESQIGSLIGNIVRGITSAGAAAGGQGIDITPTVFTAEIPIAQPATQGVSAAPPAGGSNTSIPVQGVPLATAGRSVPTFVSTTSFTSPPPIAGVYVHVHCNLNELDEVPERLARLHASVPNVSTRVHHHGLGQPMPSQAMPPAASMNVPTFPSGERQGMPYIPRERSAPQAATEPQAPAPSEANASAPAQQENRASELLQVFSSIIMSLPGTSMITLFLGNWVALIPVREALRNAVQTHRAAFDSYPEQVYDQLFTTPEVAAMVRQHDRGSEPREALTRWIRENLLSLMSCLESTVPDQEWCVTLRRSLVRLVGGASHYVTNWLGENQFSVVAQPLVAECVHNLQQVAFQGMAMNYIRSGIPQWESEYASQLAQPTDAVMPTEADADTGSELAESDNSGFSDLVNSLLDETTAEPVPEEVREWVASTGNSEVEEPLLQMLRIETHSIELPGDETIPRSGIWQLYNQTQQGNQRN